MASNGLGRIARMMMTASGGVVCLGLTMMMPAQAQYRHVTLDSTEPASLPRKVVLLEPEIVVREISAGGVVEKLPEATKKAIDNLQTSLRGAMGKRTDLEMIESAKLSADEQSLLDDYAATIYQLGLTAYSKAQLQGAWRTKVTNFDYTVGPGLKFLKEKTGADAALLMVGEDAISSGGRKALMVLAALAARVVIAGGTSAVMFAFIDLETGNLMWINADLSGTKDLSDSKAADEMVNAALGAYPKAGAR